MKSTGERLLPSITNESMIEHLHRYSLAKEFCRNKTILDIACGEGYGSNLISEVAEHIYAIDIDQEAINNAKEKYIKKNLEFKCSSIENIPLENNSVDVILCFETIEHVSDYIKALKELKRVLKKEGLLIISTPNKTNYTDRTGYHNPFHIHEFIKSEFNELLSGFFKYNEFLSQGFLYGSFLWNENKMTNTRFYDGNYNKIVCLPSEDSELYFIVLCSDHPFTFPAINSFFKANDLLIETYKVYSSKSYIIGHAILYPLLLIKKLFQRKK